MWVLATLPLMTKLGIHVPQTIQLGSARKSGISDRFKSKQERFVEKKILLNFQAVLERTTRRTLTQQTR